MAKVALAEYMREKPLAARGRVGMSGPFVTVSRQYGCYGFSLGLLLREVLNEHAPPTHGWQVYNKEILNRLATETHLAAELLEAERKSKPRLVVDFFRAFAPERIPSGVEIRKKVTTIVRGLAMRGHAIIIGQGSAGATADLANGLSVRLEAPEDWRVSQIALRERVSLDEARQLIAQREQEREYLREIYEQIFPRKPAFNLVYDCSAFTLAQIAQHVVCAMRLKGCV